MFDWLSDALGNSSAVVTGSRRLARVLGQRYADLQVEAGRQAWRSPAILSLRDWTTRWTDTAAHSVPAPARLTSSQSRVLWERSLTRNLPASAQTSGALVRQARDAWARLRASCVPLDALPGSVRSFDQRVFANAARDYAAHLENENWVDDAGLVELATGLVDQGVADPGPRLVFAGFDRFTPAEEQLREALRRRGIEITDVEASQKPATAMLAAYETADAEMRAAGAWARARLLQDPDSRVGIVAMHLERDAARHARLAREGVAPGWQTGGAAHAAAVNVSYGRQLRSYPAIAVALLALQWLQRDIGSAELSRLLRSGAIGPADNGARARTDLELRDLPGMTWSPASFVKAFGGRSDGREHWLSCVQALGERRPGMSGNRSPADWAQTISEILGELGWPGEAPLASDEFQLVNRWRELLNDLARLALVVPRMTFGEALTRLQVMAGETIFQPESSDSGVQLLGPLEAAGLEFDCLWISGLSAANWPPRGNPSVLLSRQLQRQFEMPDYEPAETLAYARRVLSRLVASAGEVHCSYALADGDAEQSPSGLLRGIVATASRAPADPGWYAGKIVASGATVIAGADPVPQVAAPESVTGGTATIQRQVAEPFSAFAFGRLGIRPVPRIGWGIPASQRGRMIHSALANLYEGIDSRDALQDMAHADLEARLATAARRSAGWLEARADNVLHHLLRLETDRMTDLMRAVVELDLARDPFDIVGLEAPVELAVEGVAMSLRVDRIDRDAGRGRVILDYKTGRRRRFLNSRNEPDDLQLVAYALALDAPVSGLAFVNVDSRQVELSGAGRTLTPDIDWDASLESWCAQVRAAIRALQQGDVRLNAALPARDAREFGLLSRVREVLHAR